MEKGVVYKRKHKYSTLYSLSVNNIFIVTVKNTLAIFIIALNHNSIKEMVRKNVRGKSLASIIGSEYIIPKTGGKVRYGCRVCLE